MGIVRKSATSVSNIIGLVKLEQCSRKSPFYRTYMSYGTHKSYNKKMERVNRNYGGYRKLISYQNATIVYDLTIFFCRKYIDFRSRTKDQMEQAARSGKQNIAEASLISATSKKSELKLLGVARASLEELLADYEDFLRQKDFVLWKKDSLEAKEARAFAYKPNRSYKIYMSYIEKSETAANALICLINQTNFLLDRQISAAEKKFVEEGGYTEKLFQRRKIRRI